MLQVPMAFVNLVASIQHKSKPLLTSVIAAKLNTLVSNAAFQSYTTDLLLWGNWKQDETNFMPKTKKSYISGYPRPASKTSFK